MFAGQKEDGTTGRCTCGGKSGMEYPGGILRMYRCLNCGRVFNRDGISGTQQQGNANAALHGDNRRTYLLKREKPPPVLLTAEGEDEGEGEDDDNKNNN